MYRHPLSATALIVALTGLIACQNDMWSPTEPAPAEFENGPSLVVNTSPGGPELVEVKFREELEVRLEPGKLRSRAGHALDGVQRVLAAHGSPAIQRLSTVPVDRLEQLRDAARVRSAGAPPDLAAWYRLSAREAAGRDRLIADLNALPEVDTAYAAPAPAPPPGYRSPLAASTVLLTGSYASRQGYLGPAPGGIEATYARTLPGGAGQGVTVIDLEYDWFFDHEDLGLPGAALIGGERYSGFGDDHGTAVLGELFGRENGLGVTGGVPGATPRTVAPFFNGSYNPASAITLASASMASGDVLLIEQQTGGPTGTYVPLEWIPSVYDAIRLATQAGKIVVEAAGNGSQNLDAPELNGRFDRGRYDSGAIIVGAGDPQHSILWFSDYGSRVDVQGWGGEVTTTGYGDLSGATKADAYTGGFSGTSSASPIVTAAAASVVGYLKAQGKPAPAPADLRSLLARTGTPQTGDLSRWIGPLPNLRAAVAALGGVGDTWTSRAPEPTARLHQSAGTIANPSGQSIVYTVGGENALSTPLRTVEAYNAVGDTWAGKAPLPAARTLLNGTAVIDRKLYVTGGITISRTLARDLWVYDPATNVWSSKAGMPVGSYGGVSAAIGRKLYVLTGKCDGCASASPAIARRFYRYDPATNVWKRLADAPGAHLTGGAKAIGGKLYVAGGYDQRGRVTSALHVYDPATNTWATKAALPTPRAEVSAGAIGDQLYLVGGYSSASGDAVARVDAYDPVTDAWASRARMPSARQGAAASVARNASGQTVLHVLGGFRGGAGVIAAHEAYTP